MLWLYDCGHSQSSFECCMITEKRGYLLDFSGILRLHDTLNQLISQKLIPYFGCSGNSATVHKRCPYRERPFCRRLRPPTAQAYGCDPLPSLELYWWTDPDGKTWSMRKVILIYSFFLSFIPMVNWSMWLNFMWKKNFGSFFFSDFLLFVFRWNALYWIEFRKKHTFTNRHVITFKTSTFDTKNFRFAADDGFYFARRFYKLALKYCFVSFIFIQSNCKYR